ncbi:MAG: [FeFe] hydrogenase H-cluster radical SAM maturase HydE [Schaedlerella sp.]|nr:[FeFe] hydrogenase H-cluster radical SAM maturase HydE [Schaedlerella sp.]
MELVEKLIRQQELTKEEYVRLLSQYENKEIADKLKEEAIRLRKKYYGDKVFIRGLIEFTNYCKNNCYYCGIRGGNKNAVRYRLTKEDILSCCENGYELGFRTFVMQGGEDLYYSDEYMAEIVREIKERYPDCAVTLSIGERSYESYKMLKEVGADRYLLRHETANERLYSYLHPSNLSLRNRMKCLEDLKSLGYQVGAGFMVGSPTQTLEDLAEDLVFLKEFEPQMVGIGPFIPHHDTKFASEQAGSVELTVFLLSIIRIILPKVLLPATTALATASEDGREKGLKAGANVVMPNLSPLNNRKKYDLYDNKVSTGGEAAESLEMLKKLIEKAGYRMVKERGDAVDVKRQESI